MKHEHSNCEHDMYDGDGINWKPFVLVHACIILSHSMNVLEEAE